MFMLGGKPINADLKWASERSSKENSTHSLLRSMFSNNICRAARWLSTALGGRLGDHSSFLNWLHSSLCLWLHDYQFERLRKERFAKESFCCTRSLITYTNWNISLFSFFRRPSETPWQTDSVQVHVCGRTHSECIQCGLSVCPVQSGQSQKSIRKHRRRIAGESAKSFSICGQQNAGEKVTLGKPVFVLGPLFTP